MAKNTQKKIKKLESQIRSITQQKPSSLSSRKESLRKEIESLQTKRNEISKKVSEAKKAKGFFGRVGISAQGIAATAKLNKRINEKKQLLNLLDQKEATEIRREINKVKSEALQEDIKIRELRREQRKRLNEDVFGTNDLFSL